MPAPSITPREAIAQLETRQDELIRRLDELNAQIEAALAEFATKQPTELPEVETRTRRRAA